MADAYKYIMFDGYSIIITNVDVMLKLNIIHVLRHMIVRHVKGRKKRKAFLEKSKLGISNLF